MRDEISVGSRGSSEWIAVNTHPHKEQLAIDNLSRQNFHSYCPMIRRRLGRGRRTVDALRPLFPGYVFVQVAQVRSKWRPILSTYGVRSVIRCGDELSYIEDGFIHSLKQREIDGAVSKPSRQLSVGDTLSIAGGPFDGLVATIISMDERDRLVLLMQMLNRSVKVKLDLQQLGTATIDLAAAS